MLGRSLALTLAAATAATVAAPGPARADDEGSEHTATLLGAAADTLGVSMQFDDRAGWSMDLRVRPGAPTRRIALPFLPADHAHYQVVVGPGRATITFVMASRAHVDLTTGAIWVVEPVAAHVPGPLLRIALASLIRVTHRWTLGDLLTADQLAQAFTVYPSMSGSIAEAARRLHRV